MSYSDNKLYYYENIIELVLTTDHVYVDNRPMNTRNIKAHRGVTNEILFTVRNRDRKLQNVSPDTLTAYIVNPFTNTRVLTKTLTNTLDIGKVKLTLHAGDLANIDKGLYRVHVTRLNASNVDSPLYSDQDNRVTFDLDITDQAYTNPTPTQSENVFLQTSSTSDGAVANVFVTNSLYGNLERNFPDACHSMAIFLDGYTGNIDVQASCLSNVPDTEDQSTDWFIVKSMQITADNANSTVTTNFTVNCNWIRVVSTPDAGTISKVQLRN